MNKVVFPAFFWNKKKEIIKDEWIAASSPYGKIRPNVPDYDLGSRRSESFLGYHVQFLAKEN